ncbi:hypothetical protein [Helicovermis profundi]|uniref:NADH dehydrogenase subunit 6 n=1 Tax=Helicovermis profundi TaxID=3065157 RepID=A0AAU9EA58_9FIRM|nr:hypothetical protein HLPR_04900 [Clostridia bacterium S502]
MDKLIDILISLGLTIFALLILVYKMMVTSAIPVIMLQKDVLIILCLLTIYFVIFNINYRKTKLILFNTVQFFIQLLLWFMTMLHSLSYQYNKYDTLVSIIGFSVMLIMFIQLVYKNMSIKNNKNKNFSI